MFFGKRLKPVENGLGIRPINGGMRLYLRLRLRRIRLFRLIGVRRFSLLSRVISELHCLRSFMNYLVSFIMLIDFICRRRVLIIIALMGYYDYFYVYSFF